MKINQIFYSIQGETLSAGFPSVFIRLTGCNLRCRYCDTAYAWTEGRDLSVHDIFRCVKKYKEANHITITGGEPLLQDEAVPLSEMLLQYYHVQIETNGSLLINRLPGKAKKIVDIKTPSSGEEGSFLMENLNLMAPADEIKFVISDDKDYNYSKSFLKKHLEKNQQVINFSPVLKKMPMQRLAGHILRDRLNVRLNIQLHKIIWPEGEPVDF